MSERKPPHVTLGWCLTLASGSRGTVINKGRATVVRGEEHQAQASGSERETSNHYVYQTHETAITCAFF